MNKKIYFAIIAGLLLADFSLAQVVIPNPLKANNFVQLLEGIAAAVAGIVGTLAVIMIIVSGIQFLTSAGSPERIGTAKKSLAYAVIGIVVAILARALVEAIKSIIGTR